MPIIAIENKMLWKNMKTISHSLRTCCNLTRKIQKNDKQNAKNARERGSNPQNHGRFFTKKSQSIMNFKLMIVYIQKQIQRTFPCQFRSQYTPAK